MMSTLFNVYLPESMGNSFCENDQIVSNNKRREAEIFSSSSRNDNYCEKLRKEDLYKGLDSIEYFVF